MLDSFSHHFEAHAPHSRMDALLLSSSRTLLPRPRLALAMPLCILYVRYVTCLIAIYTLTEFKFMILFDFNLYIDRIQIYDLKSISSNLYMYLYRCNFFMHMGDKECVALTFLPSPFGRFEILCFMGD